MTNAILIPDRMHGLIKSNAHYYQGPTSEYRKVGTCFWVRHDDDVCEASCGYAFTMEHGDFLDNEFNFCPKCGDKIEVQDDAKVR